MEISSKIRETKNKLAFNKLVKDNWGYTDESYKLFRQRLLYERPLANEYRDIIGDSPDLRKRFPVSNDDDFVELFMSSDKGFSYFKRIFYDFRETYNISYSDFNKNKFMKGKNETKIFKGIKQYYFEIAEKFYDKKTEKFFTKDVDSNSAFYSFVRFVSLFLEALGAAYPSEDQLDRKISKFLSDKIGENVILAQGLLPMDASIENGTIIIPIIRGTGDYKIKTIKDLHEFIDFMITQSSDLIGKYKAPSNRNIELVFSLNPVDWFLCSTAEKWSSCLGIYSDYMFWMGLPGLIGDKNRALVYITDGKKKTFSFYNKKTGKDLDMEVDRFMSRSWVLLARKKKTHEVGIEIVKEYPNSIGIDRLIEKNINIPSLSSLLSSGGSAVGRHYVEALYFKSSNYRKKNAKIYFSVYLDTCTINQAKKNKAKYNKTGYLWYKFSTDGSVKSIVYDEDSENALTGQAYYSEDFFEDYHDESSYKSKFDYMLREEIPFNRCISY